MKTNIEKLKEYHDKYYKLIDEINILIKKEKESSTKKKKEYNI